MTGTVRVGDTARRPVRPNTDLVQRVLRVLEEAQQQWAPRALGVDEEGREVLSWIPGETATSGEQVDIAALARIVRRLHDLTVPLAAGFDCVIHDDLQPRNVVVRERSPVGLIDWEQARPGHRVEDVANLCWSFSEPTSTSDPVELGRRWRLVATAYGLEGIGALVSTVISRMGVCVTDIERGAAEGSARHQVLAARGDHLSIRTMLAWVVEHEPVLQKAISTPHPTR